MEQQTNQHSVFPELSNAISNGYSHDFTLRADGLVRCPSSPGKGYDLDEMSITVIPCPSFKASLYLIQTYDGLRGTLVEYHEF